MTVKFVPVRIGHFRQDIQIERHLKLNYDNLKIHLREFINDLPGENQIDMDIVIPGKGVNITITLDSIKDSHVKNQLIQNFSNSIYKGDNSILKQNMNNPIFPIGT